MRVTGHAATKHDLDVAASAVVNTRAVSVASGQILIDGAHPPSPYFTTQPFQVGSLRGDWVVTARTANNGVVLYLHGRRFQYDEEPDILAARLSAATRLPVLLLHYRLAPQHPYPAAVDDTISAYRALLDQGIPPARVAIVGHSAGGTLVLSALITMQRIGLAMPAAAAAISPITDFTFSGDSMAANAGVDTMTLAEAEQVRVAYLGDAAPDASPQSPLAGVGPGLPSLYLACGEREMLRDDVMAFAERAAADGNDVTFDLYSGMPHGFPVLPLSAADSVLERIGTFTSARMGGMESATEPRPVTVRRIGWAGYEIVSEAGTRVLVDPYLCDSSAQGPGLPQSPVAPAELAGADVIAVTHAGYDHRGQAIEIAKAGSATLVCGSALYKAAIAAGVPRDRVCPMVSGVEFSCRDVTLKSLPARHESTMTVEGEFVADQPQSVLVTTTGGSRIFCGGDTSLSADLQMWGDVYRPDVAILGIGGVWVGAVKIVELPPADAALAVRMLGASTVIPVHYHPDDPAPAQLIAELTVAGTTADVAVLAIGDTWRSTG